MNIGGYEIPMASTVMPWILLVMLVSVAIVFIKRLYNDKELTLKKVAFLVAAMVLMFYAMVNMGSLLTWGSGIIGKAITLTNNIQV
jgi:Ca2+/Na+ antiporter